MKKHFGILLLLFCALTSSCLVPAKNQDQPVKGSGLFLLPESLLVIDDEAFSGTSASRVVLQPNLTDINDRAFSENSLLKEVFIPPSVSCIADNAFEGSDGVVIFGERGSYADNWAHRNEIPFCPLDFLNPDVRRNLIDPGTLSAGHNEKIPDAYDYSVLKKGWEYAEKHSISPKDRIELRIIDYWFP